MYYNNTCILLLHKLCGITQEDSTQSSLPHCPEWYKLVLFKGVDF